MVKFSSDAGVTCSGLEFNVWAAGVFFKWHKFIYKMNIIHYSAVPGP